MNNLAEARKYIDGFRRPDGLNVYSWRAVKKLALHAWDCYLNGKRFNHSINFMCREFYLMIRDPKGEFIIPNTKFSHAHDIIA